MLTRFSTSGSWWPMHCLPPMPKARGRNVKRREPPVAVAHDAVVCTARVYVVSRDRPHPAGAIGDKGALRRTSARARSVNRREPAVASAQEAVVHIARVQVVSEDRPRWVVEEGGSALAGACARARGIERDDGRRPLSAPGKAQPHHAQGQAKGERSFLPECRTELGKGTLRRCHPRGG